MKLTVVSLWMTAFALSAMAGQPLPAGDWSSVSGLAPGSEMRIFLSDGRTLRGSLEAATSDSLTINVSKGQEVHQRQDIRRVQLKRQGRRGRNTLVGLAIGAGAGAAVGAVEDATSPNNAFVLVPHSGVMLFASAGAIIGTVVGLVFPTSAWPDVYRAP